MEIINTTFKDLYIINITPHKDLRGQFAKQFSKSVFESYNLRSEFCESFYSISQKSVIRGMHFQTPPKEHAKLVYVSNGSIIDVVLDLRQDSTTYKKSFYIKLDSTNLKCLYIPEGFAHGFLSLEDNTKVHYMQTSEYDKDYDCGIKYDSFGFEWNKIAKQYDIDKFIISNRDLSFSDRIEGYF